MEEYILGENVKSEKKYIHVLVILDTRVLQQVQYYPGSVTRYTGRVVE